MTRRPPRSLTGDRYLETLVPSAEKLVAAVRRDDMMFVEAMLADAEMVYDDPLTGAHALVVLLAAMVPDDQAAADLLRWRANPHEYQRLRAAGVSAAEAARLATQVSPIRKETAA
ncbi:hypothetical protein L3Q65_45935 [Amycolatopsis sp. FU40]|uniref:hypothetical protein n=1 Tax=Amycolatopsis sp. FU40 TaxID=2914159 RepID=UPI001F1AF49E|nr:hypothetical protein [Amycolatopsis sp. FU40]UKD55115.1 hypothetical protein L3Q65_45935 [Amycolatopsis sp. FU40]